MGDSLSSISRVGKKVNGCCKQATALLRGRNHRPVVACLCLDGQERAVTRTVHSPSSRPPPHSGRSLFFLDIAIEDMNARKLGAHSQRSHISSCERFAAFLKRSPDMATPDDVRRFQLHLAETGMSICNRNRIMTGVKFLFRVTLRRLDPAKLRRGVASVAEFLYKTGESWHAGLLMW
jgi:Phage integrase, N-terminal SAM-like domain